MHDLTLNNSKFATIRGMRRCRRMSTMGLPHTDAKLTDMKFKRRLSVGENSNFRTVVRDVLQEQKSGIPTQPMALFSPSKLGKSSTHPKHENRRTPSQSHPISIPDGRKRTLNGKRKEGNCEAGSLFSLSEDCNHNHENDIFSLHTMDLPKKKHRRDSDFSLSKLSNPLSASVGSNKRRRRSDIIQTLSAWRNDRSAPIKTLRQFLMKKSRTNLFRQFLKKEYSEENLDFWLEIEDYRKVKSNKLLKAATIIYENYIVVGSPREINIDAGTRTAIVTNMKDPDATTFDLAQARVFLLMERDSFRRFALKESHTSPNKEKAPKRDVAKDEAAKRQIFISENKSKFSDIIHPNITQRRRTKTSV
ncbi:uncharacterized protein LOC100176924 [Ciona intestinalis]